VSNLSVYDIRPDVVSKLHWKIQIELFSNKSGMADLAKEVQKSVSELGFFDIQVKDANIRGLQRKLINASGVVDNRTLLVTKN